MAHRSLCAPPGRTAEPDEAARPAAFDATGDVWQRQGPPGTATWWCATRHVGVHARARTWTQLDESILGPMTPLRRPRLPEPPYTDELALTGDPPTDRLVLA